jgi:hypothetical protein
MAPTLSALFSIHAYDGSGFWRFPAKAQCREPKKFNAMATPEAIASAMMGKRPTMGGPKAMQSA